MIHSIAGELGLDMGNNIMPGMDEVQYRINAQGENQQVLGDSDAADASA